MQAARLYQDLHQVASQAGQSVTTYFEYQVLKLLAADLGIGHQLAHIPVGSKHTQQLQCGRPLLSLARLLSEFKYRAGIRSGNG